MNTTFMSCGQALIVLTGDQINTVRDERVRARLHVEPLSTL